MASLLVASHAAARAKGRRISSPVERIRLGAGPWLRGWERQRAAHTHEEPEGEGGGGRVGAEAEPQDASEGGGWGLRLCLDPRKGSPRPRPPGGGVLSGHALRPPPPPHTQKHTPDTQAHVPYTPRLEGSEKDVPRPSSGMGGSLSRASLNPRYSDAARPGVCQPKLGHTTRGPPRRVERIEGR